MNNIVYNDISYKRLSSKGKFLFWWMLFLFGYFNIALTNAFMPNRDVAFVLNFALGLYAFFRFRYKGSNMLYVKQNTKYIWLLMGVMIISAFVPWIDYGQDFISTLISQRFNYYILFALVLYAIRPEEGELMCIFRICARISVVMFLLGNLFPAWFVDATKLQETLASRIAHDSTDIGFGCPGFGVLVMYFFFCCGKLRQNPKTKDVLELLILLGVIIAVQNRSTILGALPAFGWCMFRMRSRHKTLVYACIGVLIIMAIPYVQIIYKSLVEETQMQLDDDNYNRWQALSFYLVEMKTKFYHYLIGNGVWSISGEYTKLMLSAQTYRGCYISDLGILGTFFYYGIVPLYIIYRYCLVALKDKQMPSSMKWYAIWIICVPIIHPYLMLTEGGNATIAFFFYFVTYFSQKNGYIYHHCKLQHKRGYQAVP